MVNRRELLRLGAALGALPLLHTAAASSASLTPATHLHKVVFDRRSAAGRSFGSEIARTAGAHLVHAIDGDVTDVWYHDLYPRWQRDPAPIAGLTDFAAIFCLERLAWDFGMRTVFRAEHGPQCDAATGLRIARVIAALPVGLPAVAPLGPPPERVHAGAPWLVSWMIAPIRRT